MLTHEDEDDRRLRQYEFVWILPGQYALIGHPRGFALRIDTFLGPGDKDIRGRKRTWVRGPVLGGDRHEVTVLIPHDQPRARRADGRVGEPPAIDPDFAHTIRPSPSYPRASNGNPAYTSPWARDAPRFP